MVSPRVAFPALAVAALAAFGCADPQYPAAQTAQAVAVGSDRYWVVGRYGFAAEGRGGSLRRFDFPETGRTPDWAWEATATDYAAGHVVVLSGRTYLLTHGGEVFRRDPAGWFPTAARFSSDAMLPGSDDVVQIDEVLTTPNGGALVHTHATQLFWVDADGLERSVMKREQLPHFFTWLGFVNGKLHGIGWEGDDRQVLVREAPDRWSKVVVVPKAMGQPDGVVPLEDGRVGVVVGGVLQVVEAGGSLRPLPMSELLPQPAKAPLVVATDDAPAPTIAAGSPPETGVIAPSPRVAVEPTPSNEAPSKEEPSKEKIQRVLQVGAGRYALVIGESYAGGETIVLLGPGGRRVVRCDILRVRRAIGVIEAKDGAVYVPTERASVVEIRADGACGEPQVPLLPDE